MPLEIEAKFRLADAGALQARLKAAGARRVGKVLEENHFFDRPDGSLRAGDRGLRVRLARSLDEPNAAQTALLTVKGPKQASELAPREAFDVEVAPADQIVPLIGALGFVHVMMFEKRRETWELDACLVELDELPELGRFAEIEGPSVEAVRGVQAKVGLSDADLEEASYSKMVSKLLKQRGEKALRFYVAG